jgi:hypothetical protein
MWCCGEKRDVGAEKRGVYKRARLVPCGVLPSTFIQI